MDSDSDCDFESADEEIESRKVAMTKPTVRRNQRPVHFSSSTIGSDSDDDDECIPRNVNTASWSTEVSTEPRRNRAAVDQTKPQNLSEELKASDVINVSSNTLETSQDVALKHVNKDDKTEIQDANLSNEKITAKSDDLNLGRTRRQRPERQRKPKDQKPTGLGAKKLGTKIMPEQLTDCPPENKIFTPSDEIKQGCWEFDDEEAMKILQQESQSLKGKSIWTKSENKSSDLEYVPEELKSNKSFKEVFKSDEWEAFDDEKKIVPIVSEEKIVEPVLEKLVAAVEEKSAGGWGSWGSWGVSSLLNSASVGVSTLSNHVSHGLTLLEESMGVPDPEDPTSTIEPSNETESCEEKKTNVEDNQSQGSFGFGNLMYGVSSITQFVESTGTKVISGGLGTLETIGKKTMEVLQDGDPGLKKKRAFFMNEGDKPILSQILREAKEKAEVEEKSVEGKQLARKVHFETLFDDFQGLVHLEALEMLSKQSNMKIQQKLVTLESDEMMSMQETLDEVKELCDLGDEDDDEEIKDESLKEKLEYACSNLGVDIKYDKINEIWEETTTYISNVSKTESEVSDVEIFQCAISTLARFTAFSVERFHKSAELLLIKERRSTVNEADALVELTKMLSGKIGTAASLFSKCLNERSKISSEPVDITTIFLEATNASSYIQDAFRLLIPILQVGAL